jgi:predicted DNA-binding transcriptional regulator AlpA
MKQAISLREISIPRFALRKDEAAASLAISPSLFDSWIERGYVPKGTPVDGVVLWDTQNIREAWLKLRDRGVPEDDGDNPYDGVVV